MRHRTIATAENKELAPGVDQQSDLKIMMVIVLTKMMIAMILLIMIKPGRR